MDRQLIERYAAGGPVPARAIEGLSREDLLAFPVPGTWSIQQIIFHLMDSDLIASDRMKRVIAEDHPTLLGYNESAFAAKLGYEHLDIRAACEVFRLNRELTAAILRRLPDDVFQRTGFHNEAGEKSLADFVHTYVDHLEGHMKFIRQKRELLGKPLGETRA
jgi:hypothetical protein